MSHIDERIAELDIEIPKQAAAPAGVYVAAVVSGNHVYTAGQLPFVNGELRVKGIVGASVSPEQAKGEARQCAINALAAIQAVIGSLDRITRVVKVVGFVASDPSFTGQASVINGASELIGAVFGEPGVHARSAVGVAVLPLGSPVEVELIVEFS